MTTLTRTRGPMLDPRITVLLRRNGTVQLGWDPENAVVLRPPGPAAAVPTLLRLLDGVHPRPEILRCAAELGFDAETTETLLSELSDAGLLMYSESPSRLRHVRVHGRGPLSDAMLAGLRRIGVRASHSRPDQTDSDHSWRYPPGQSAPGRSRAGQCPPGRAHPGNSSSDHSSADRPDLVVLADALVPDPALVAELMRGRIPHLQVRMRDGRGIIGPLVLPGETSCLRCADLSRCELDPDWPHLCAQLLNRAGTATPAALAATAALALHEVDTIAHGSPDHPPATLNATLELNLDSPHLDFRPWRPHPQCGCLDSAEGAQGVAESVLAAAGEAVSCEICSGGADPAAPGNSRKGLL